MPNDQRDPFGAFEPERPPATFDAISGQLADPATLTREELERQAPEIARMLAQCALGQISMTYQQIQAAKLVIDKLVAAAAQRLDIRQVIEVRDKRAAIDAMVESILAPGAVVRRPDGGVVLNLPATVTEARLARADGRGPPEVDATGVPLPDSAPPSL